MDVAVDVGRNGRTRKSPFVLQRAQVASKNIACMRGMRDDRNVPESSLPAQVYGVEAPNEVLCIITAFS